MKGKLKMPRKVDVKAAKETVKTNKEVMRNAKKEATANMILLMKDPSDNETAKKLRENVSNFVNAGKVIALNEDRLEKAAGA